MLSTASKLLLTAFVSLAVGAGGTYAITVHVAATCAPITIDGDGKGHFADGPYLPVTGGHGY